ncbi:hypothetical protein [Fusibacter sp. JL216-2]|uniref:hypothetical protein n=1 Tax=Fusibacter sp. JL216-2 TaxID=3071453 RepID=UPI003D35301A
MMIQWRYPSNDYGENKGINDSGVAMFRGTPLKSLAREICQNSLDASTNLPVRIDFNVFEIDSGQLPGRDSLEDSFTRCLEFWKSQKARATKDFFTNAKEKISQEKCSVLRISDFNTCGLTGSKEDINTNWTNLTKSSGASDKRGTAGGSFGIGKFAPFACSEFSTVYYSTYDVEGFSAYQGVSRIVTFTREDGENTQGIGYYGNDKNTPVYEQLEIDRSFRRSDAEYGTDIYIAGYKYAGEEWEQKILISILDGFLGAIWDGKLIVNVGSIEISKDTLSDLVDTYKDDLTGYTEKYYEVLVSENTHWKTEDFNGLGELKLGILLGDPNAPRRVAMIRQTGMKIMDRDRLSGHIPFAGVMFINGEDINKRLRLIENPEHTEWQPDRSPHPTREKELLRTLNNYIRDWINELVSNGSDQEIDAVGVGHFLPDEIEESQEEVKEEAVSDKVVEVEKKKVERRAPSSSNIQESSEEYDVEDVRGSSPGGDGTGWEHDDDKRTKEDKRDPKPTGNSEGEESQVKTVVDVKFQKFLPICVDKENGKYAMVIVPETDGIEGVLELFLSAETQQYKAPILDANVINGKCIVADNKIKGVEFKKGQPIRLSLVLDYYDYCSLEVKAYATSV